MTYKEGSRGRERWAVWAVTRTVIGRDGFLAVRVHGFAKTKWAPR